MMEFDKIIELIHAVSESKLTEFRLQDGEWKISMETVRKKEQAVVTVVQTPAEAGMKQEPQEVSAAAPEEKILEEQAGNVIKSPLVGTFYRASSPDNPPYVQVGDMVKKGQVLGIVEAMKLMNEIESDYEGTIKEILVENEQMVEYGQPLFVIE